MGASAVVYAGIGAKDHCRVAIQMNSRDIVQKRIYTHTGWQQIDGTWYFLHAEGAIGPEIGASDVTDEENGPTKNGEKSPLMIQERGSGPDGPIGPSINVDMAQNGQLRHYILPKPEDARTQMESVCASLKILDLVPDELAFPLYCLVWRAVLGQASVSIHLAGLTGTGKSELAALVQQHFGATMNARNLPASWSSTGNALEGMAFLAKDVVLTVDDFVPTGSSYDVRKLNMTAERLFRAQGNQSARQRMRYDASLRPAKPPRGSILSTGEDTPRGQSLRARVLILEIEEGDLNWDKLLACQAEAAEGLYAQAMAGYTQWLAPQMDTLKHEIKSQMTELRRRATTSNQHKRTPEMVAELYLGFEFFLKYALTIGAITREEAEILSERCWEALGVAANRQADHLAASDQVQLYLELLNASFMSGSAHLVNKDGGVPVNPQVWGWKSWHPTEPNIDGLSGEWMRRGSQIGWVTEEGIFLDHHAAFKAANQMAGQDGEGITISVGTLNKRLKEKGMLASVDEKRGKILIRRTLESKRRDVLHLKLSALIPEIEAQQAHLAPDPHLGAKKEVLGDDKWAATELRGQEIDPTKGPILTPSVDHTASKSEAKDAAPPTLDAEPHEPTSEDKPEEGRKRK